MAASSLALTVRSVNDVIITAETRTFITSRITELKTNANPATTMSVTEVGDGSNQLSLWKIYGTGEKMYWTLQNTASNTYAVTLYSAMGGRKLAYGYLVTGGGTTGTIYGSPVNESGVSFSVYFSYSADDTGSTNSVQCTTFSDALDPELPGATQFMYDMGNGYLVKFTVDETVTSINASISGDNQWLDAAEDLTTAQITILNGTPVEIITAPGAGYVIELESAFLNYDHDTADITGNVTADLVTSTTNTRLMTAANGFSGAADKITRFVDVAGVVDSNEGISIMMNTGNPTMGASAGTAKVVVTYKITAI